MLFLVKDGGIVGSFGEMYLSYSLVPTDFCVINRNIYIYILCIYIYIGNVLFGTRASKLGNGMGQFLRSSMGDMFMPSIYYKAKKIVTCDMRRC